MTNITKSIAIARPYVNFAICKAAFDSFAVLQNQKKEEKKQLRSVHHELFYKLVRFYSVQLSKEKENLGEFKLGFTSNTFPVLHTSNISLSAELKRDKATIYRQITRLIEVGVIVRKIHHGHNHKFELLINPQLLLIFDEENLSYLPKCEFLPETQLIDLLKASVRAIANCNGNQNIYTRNLNNIIINVEKVNSCDKKILTGNTEAREKGIDDPRTQAEKEYCARLHVSDERIRELKKRYSKVLFTTALNCIWKGCTIYEGERERTLEYLESNYFEHCLSENAIVRSFAEYKWRIEAAGRHIQHKSSFAMHIFPFSYFNLNNDKGFKGTKKWFNTHLNNQKLRAIKHKEFTDEVTLNKIVFKYKETPDYVTFMQCEAYIQKNIPNLLERFYDYVITNKYSRHANV